MTVRQTLQNHQDFVHVVPLVPGPKGPSLYQPLQEL